MCKVNATRWDVQSESVRRTEKVGDDAADLAVDLGRWRQNGRGHQCQAHSSKLCKDLFPRVGHLHRFFIAVSGWSLTAVKEVMGLLIIPSSGVVEGFPSVFGCKVQCEFAALPGPRQLWSGSWQGWLSVDILVKFVSFLSSSHWRSNCSGSGE